MIAHTIDIVIPCFLGKIDAMLSVKTEITLKTDVVDSFGDTRSYSNKILTYSKVNFEASEWTWNDSEQRFSRSTRVRIGLS